VNFGYNKIRVTAWMVAVCREIPRFARDQGFVTPLSGDKALELSTARRLKTVAEVFYKEYN